MNDRWASLLGIANRARQVISGEDLVVKEIQRKTAKLILLSRDASENTQKRICNKCEFYGVPLHMVPNRHQLGHAIGKDTRVVVAILESGFAKKLLSLLD